MSVNNSRLGRSGGKKPRSRSYDKLNQSDAIMDMSRISKKSLDKVSGDGVSVLAYNPNGAGPPGKRKSGEEKQEVKRVHDLYKDTYYFPNNRMRLLEVPMNASLGFQKLLWFHSAYLPVYIIIMLIGQFHRMSVFGDGMSIGLIGAWVLLIPLETYRMRVAYRGNI